jgi:plastocyanin
MSRWLTVSSLLVALVVGALIRLAAPSAVVAGDPCYHGYDIPERTTADATQIKLMPCAFGPTIAHVPVGATVTWVNGPDWAHLVTGANEEWGSRDDEIAPNASVSYTFAKAGTYPYACALHRGMSGVIVVGDAPPAARVQAADATPPETDTGAGFPTSDRAGTPSLAALGIGLILGAVVSVLITVVAVRRRGKSAGVG